MIKVSVIIPVYNCEKYLEQCIRSAYSQTIENKEIICIDDGSTDSSAQIIKGLQSEGIEIYYFYQKNKGPGEARNVGIKKAKGKYITFLDADDYYFDENALQLMFDLCEEKKIFACGNQRMMQIKFDKVEWKTLFPPDTKGRILNYRDYQVDYYYQNFLFLREMLIERGIFFPDYRRYQDPPFFVKALYCADKFAVSDSCLYCYRVSDMEKKFNASKTEDMIRGINDNLQFAIDNDLDSLFGVTLERLEYNLADIIYENISCDNFSILELLIQANKIVKRKYNYVIRPLKMILFSEKQYKKQILKKISLYNEISLYGAGRYTRLFLVFLKKNSLLDKVTNLVVSDLEGNTEEIEGVPVIRLQEFLKKEKVHLFITTNGKNQKEISKFLIKNGYNDYEIVEEIFLEKLDNKYCLEGTNNV